MQPYFILSAHDASGQSLLDVGINPFWWQVFLSAAGMIAFINSMLVGILAGLLLAVFTLPLLVCTSAGVVTFLVSFGILQRYQWLHWRHLEQKLTVLFQVSPVGRNELSPYKFVFYFPYATRNHIRINSS